MFRFVKHSLNEKGFKESVVLGVDVEVTEQNGYKLDSLGRPVGAQVVDGADAKDFERAENGFRRNDIAVLLSAESDDLKRALVEKLNELRKTYPDQSLSDAEIAAQIIPRSVNTQSALRDWSVRSGAFTKRLEAEYNKRMEESRKSANTITFEGDGEQKSES